MHKGGRVSEFGGPEVLESGDWPEPELRDGWVVVELRAAALNWHDCLVRQGVHDVDLPQIIGADGAGRRRGTGGRNRSRSCARADDW